jgi:hypothetical protein
MSGLPFQSVAKSCTVEISQPQPSAFQASAASSATVRSISWPIPVMTGTGIVVDPPNFLGVEYGGPASTRHPDQCR